MLIPPSPPQLLVSSDNLFIRDRLGLKPSGDIWEGGEKMSSQIGSTFIKKRVKVSFVLSWQ